MLHLQHIFMYSSRNMHNFITYFKFLYINKSHTKFYKIFSFIQYLMHHLIYILNRNFYPFLNLSNNIDKVIKMIIQINVAMKPL